MNGLQKLLTIPNDRIDSINAVFTDPDSQVMNGFPGGCG